jgi:hypothetical protein
MSEIGSNPAGRRIPHAGRVRSPIWLWFSGSILLLCLIGFSATAAETNRPVKPDRFIVYTNAVDPETPMSVHIVKVEYARPEVQFYTTLGGGAVMGMDIVSEQIKAVPPSIGQPLAAINGDFYDKSQDYPARPRDLQIRQGELITAPAGHTCFWMDRDGRPQMTNVFSRFRIVWPDGKTTPFGLNVPRTNGTVVLYTAALGRSTLTKGGSEYVLENATPEAPLRLRVGQTHAVRVRSVQTAGNQPLDADTAVLSVGPEVAGVPRLETGAALQIITETLPDLTGSPVAIGGGPALVKDSKVMEWKGWVHVKHPRTALGWNQKHLYLVQVDGRQLDVSLGMAFPDLADYLLKIGCTDAMNLDGGGSSTLWAFGSVRNSPSEGQERPSPNAFVVVRKNPANSEAK